MEGWIKIHRSIEEWEWESNPLMYYFWVRLLVRVNHEDKEWQGETIPRGSMVTSLSKMSSEFHLSVKQIRVFLERLTKGKQLVVKTTNKWTKITICKYDDYQVVGQAEGQTKGKQMGTKRATTKEEKKKEDINISLVNAPAYTREEEVKDDWRFISSVRRSLLGNDKNRIAEYKKEIFSKEVLALADQVGMTSQQQTAFISWWTERSPGSEKIKAEFEVAFDMESRMRSWVERDKPKYQQPKQQAPKSRMDALQDDLNFIHNYFHGNQQSATAPDEQ